MSKFPLALPTLQVGVNHEAAPTVHEQKLHRTMVQMLGHLNNISTSLRVIADSLAGGSRAEARASLTRLLNTDPTASEDGQHTHTLHRTPRRPQATLHTYARKE